jgi:hypothetical protein
MSQVRASGLTLAPGGHAALRDVINKNVTSRSS